MITPTNTREYRNSSYNTSEEKSVPKDNNFLKNFFSKCLYSKDGFVSSISKYLGLDIVPLSYPEIVETLKELDDNSNSLIVSNRDESQVEHLRTRFKLSEEEISLIQQALDNYLNQEKLLSLLTENDYLDQFLEFANQAPDHLKDIFLHTISKALVEKTKINQALDNARGIEDRQLEKRCIKYIIFETEDKNSIVDKAIKVANRISFTQPQLRDTAFQYIFKALFFDKALEIAENDRNSGDIENIFDSLTYKIYLKVKETLKSISESGSEIKIEMLKDISRALADHGNVKKALKFAQKITDMKEQKKFVTAIFNLLIARKTKDQKIEKLFNKKLNDTIKNDIYQNQSYLKNHFNFNQEKLLIVKKHS